MPAHIISLEQHQRLLEAYRDRPAAFSRAAKEAGINERTAKRYWEQGHPDAPDQRSRAIKDLIAEEQVATRARMVDLQQSVDTLAAELEAKRRTEQASAAQKDVTDSRVQEAQMVRMARGAATGLLVTLTNLSKSTARVGVRVAKTLDKMAQDPADMTRGEVVDMVRTIGALTTALRQANDAGKQAMEMERVLLGEPSHIVAHVHLQDVTLDEAERRINAGMRALERAKARGFVVDGKVVAHSAGMSAGTPSPGRAAPEGTSPGAPLEGVGKAS